MPKVFCASIECVYNKGNQCKAAGINLSDGHVHTVHQGYLQIWKCRTFSMSKEAKEMYELLKNANLPKEG